MYLGQQGFDRNSQSIFIKKFLIKLAFPIRNSDAIFAFSSLVGSKSNEEAKRLTWQQPQSSLVTLGQNSMIRQKFQFLFQIIQKWIKSSEEKIVKIQPTSNQFSKKIMNQSLYFVPVWVLLRFQIIDEKGEDDDDGKEERKLPSNQLTNQVLH